jgi:hypothetical protein
MTEKDKIPYESKAGKDKERYEAEKRAYNVPFLPPSIPPLTVLHGKRILSHTHFLAGLAAISSTFAHIARRKQSNFEIMSLSLSLLRGTASCRNSLFCFCYMSMG